MRTGWVLLVGIVAVSSACGGNDSQAADDSVTYGADCSQVCESAAHCSSPPAAESCLSTCEEQRDVFNQSSWNVLTECIGGDSCVSTDDCMHQAALAAPASSVDTFLNSVCDWALRCAGNQITKPQCLDMLHNVLVSDDGASAWDALRVVKSSAMSCMTACVQALSCGELDFGKAAASCGELCGFGSGADDSDTSSSCVVQHGNCGDHGAMVQSDDGSCECQCDSGFVSSDYVCVSG